MKKIMGSAFLFCQFLYSNTYAENPGWNKALACLASIDAIASIRESRRLTNNFFIFTDTNEKKPFLYIYTTSFAGLRELPQEPKAHLRLPYGRGTSGYAYFSVGISGFKRIEADGKVTMTYTSPSITLPPVLLAGEPRATQQDVRNAARTSHGVTVISGTYFGEKPEDPKDIKYSPIANDGEFWSTEKLDPVAVAYLGQILEKAIQGIHESVQGSVAMREHCPGMGCDRRVDFSKVNQDLTLALNTCENASDFFKRPSLKQAVQGQRKLGMITSRGDAK